MASRIGPVIHNARAPLLTRMRMDRYRLRGHTDTMRVTARCPSCRDGLRFSLGVVNGEITEVYCNGCGTVLLELPAPVDVAAIGPVDAVLPDWYRRMVTWRDGPAVTPAQSRTPR